MSFQAGMFYLDGREIADYEAAAIRSSIRSDDCESPAGHRQPAVFLAHAASHPNGRTPDKTQPCLGQRSVVTFDGRLDNREDLLLRLRSGLQADTSNAALAAAAYEAWGPDGLAHLVGDWSLVIWDTTRRAILLASDFAGVRPLYYCVQPNRVLWSTRLRALVDWAEAGEIDDMYVAGLLAFTGCPHRTPYRGVYSAPPGHVVEVTAGGTRILPFWKLPMADTICYSRESEYEDHLRSLFRESVKCRIPTDSLCLCDLSGGLDSSSVVSMAAETIRAGDVRPERFVTLTVEHPGSRDQPFYKAIEAFCSLDSIHLSAASYPFLTETDTGGAQPAFWGTLQKHTADVARQIGATTYLTGRLGDDIMGNWWDDSAQVAGLFRQGRIGSALQQALAWSKVLRVPIHGVLWRALLSSLPPSLAPAQAYRLTGCPDKSQDLQDSVAPTFRKRTGLSDPQTFFSQEWIHSRPERRKHLHSLMLSLELRRLQPPEALEHLDYVHPYAHRPLVAFMSSIPADIVCRPGEPRRLMRRAFQQLWPPQLRQRRSKDGFEGVFLDSLRPLAGELLKPGRPLQVVERGYIERESLEKRLDRLSLSLSCNETQLRQIILLEFWLRDRESRLRTKPMSLPA